MYKKISLISIVVLFSCVSIQAQSASSALNYCPNLKYFQQVGSKDKTNSGETTKLQKFLKQNLQLTDSQFIVTGFFGLITREFVKQFQENNGLIVTGIVGSPTRSKIIATCSTQTTPLESTCNSYCPTPSTGCYYQNPPINSCGCGTLICQSSVSTSTATTTSVSLYNFTATPTTGTYPLLVRFSASAVGSETFSVDFGDGQSSSLQNNCFFGTSCGLSTVEHTYANPGIYTAILMKKYTCPNIPNTSCIALASFEVARKTITVSGQVIKNPGNNSCQFNGQTVSSGQSVTAYQAPFNTNSIGIPKECSQEVRTCTNGSLSGTYTLSACDYSIYVCAQPPMPTCPVGLSCVQVMPQLKTYTSYAEMTRDRAQFMYVGGCLDTTPTPILSCSFNGQTVSSGQSVTAYQTSTVSYGSQCVSEQRSCSSGTLSGSYTNARCSVGQASSCTLNGQIIAHNSGITTYQSATVPYGSTCQSQIRTCTNGTLSGSFTNTSCSVTGAQSCSAGGVTIGNLLSRSFYLAPTVPYGSTCQSENRTCTNGNLSGSYTNATCSVSAALSCSFNGQTVAHGSSVTAYNISSVTSPDTCLSHQETRTCSNGTLSGSYTSANCSVTYPVSPSQSVIVNLNNVYSPELVKVNGQLKMYFGGWKDSGQINDNIYVADCLDDGNTCTNVRSVINPLTYNLVHVNDPSIVLVPASGNTPAYYIMYMTVLKTGGYNNISDTNISYSTSWANDGINWSAPTLLLNGFWLPSAVRKPDGNIELFAYGLPGTNNPFLTKYSMGLSGISPQSIGQVAILNIATQQPGAEANAYVTYNQSLGFYQILGESMPTNGKSEIDYLTSNDGLSWGIQKTGIVKPETGQYRVGTPAPLPDNLFKVFFGSTERADSLYLKIRNQIWSK